MLDFHYQLWSFFQDVYDQRNLDVAEGKALDDNVSWLGIKRQGSYPTNGEPMAKSNIPSRNIFKSGIVKSGSS